MYPRTNYTMTEADYNQIIEACKPVPMIMLQLGMPRSQQERANDAWAELGGRMGFDSMTVEPGRSKLEFTAVPSESATQRDERLKAEAETKRRSEMIRLAADIEELQDKLDTLRKDQ